MKLKALVLTDHADHTAENSLYGLLQALLGHPQIESVDVATRHNPLNERFFVDLYGEKIFVSAVHNDFHFDGNGSAFFQDMHPATLDDYDFVLLRLPPPLNQPLLDFLKRKAKRPVFVNDPEGINLVGNKRFLLNFKDICPPMKLLRSVDEIQAFSEQFPVVLKPLNNYGGRGILRVEDGNVLEDGQETPLEEYFENVKPDTVEFLGMQFLKNVVQGDKRILVVDGKVMGASLRL
ncbi:MAG: glutathione synthetase, partial [Phaeodactylibacter sp.]|nr:glutathione synthetase [Phaeodactylibacter sp.]